MLDSKEAVVTLNAVWIGLCCTTQIVFTCVLPDRAKIQTVSKRHVRLGGED